MKFMHFPKKKKKKKKGKNTFLVLIFWGVFILVPKIYNVFILILDFLDAGSFESLPSLFSLFFRNLLIKYNISLKN
jgi:hypothetical protein